MAKSTICSVENCGKRTCARGWCEKHYARWIRTGTPLGMAFGLPEQFIQENVLNFREDACLLNWPFCRTSQGYPMARVNGKSIVVSRYVCEKTHGPPPTPEHQAAHSCGNGHLGCLAQKHLSWKTRLENKADEILHGTRQYGERNAQIKLSDADVLEIRALGGSFLQRQIAERFGVSRSCISIILSGKSRAIAHRPSPQIGPRH